MKEMFGPFSSHWLGTDHFYFHQRGLIQLKGKLAPVRIYECFDGIDEQDLDRQLKALPFYMQGVLEFFDNSFKEASDRFYGVLEIFPEDKTAKLFLGRSNQYRNVGISDNCTGIEEMEFK